MSILFPTLPKQPGLTMWYSTLLSTSPPAAGDME